MPASASSTKWRLLITASSGGGTVTIYVAELAIFTNGTNLCTGGTATSNASSGVQTPEKAFDGNANTYWTSAGSAPHWLQYEFATPVTDPTSYRITIPTTATGTPTPSSPASRAPKVFKLQFWDGAAWVDYDVQTGNLTTTSIWTASPVQTFVTSPPAATAVTTLPYLATVTLAPGETRWWAYTADVTDVIGLLATLPPTADTFTVSIRSPWVGTPYHGFTAVETPLQFPVTAGGTYYIKIQNTDLVPLDCALSLIRAPAEAVPVGSIFVHDDVAGLPLAILSQTTGAVIRFRQPVAAGEYADVLPDGRYLVDDSYGDGNLKLYSGQTALLAQVPYHTTVPVTKFLPVRSNKAHAFYIGNPADVDQGNATTARRFDADTLTFGATTWVLTPTLTGLTALAPSLDETILYYAAATTAAPIKRWDLINNVALSNLAAGITNSQPRNDILVLNDDTILAAYAGTGFYGVKRYAADGTVLNTYTVPALNDIMLAYALDDPVSFWVWLKHVPAIGISRFQNIRVSDGVVLTTFDATMFDNGVYLPVARPVDPADYVRFGHSFSCHFFIMRQAIAAPAPPPLPLPACVQGCIPSLDAIAGGGQGCLSTLTPGTDGGQGCSLPAAPDVECA